MTLAPEIASFERELREAIDPSELQRHLEVFNTLQRLDGTEDERKSVEYIADEMRKVGVECDVLEYETFVSRPGPGRLQVISPEQLELPTRTRAFSPSTSPGGLEVELAWVASESTGKDKMIFTHHGREEDFKGLDLRGKAVLTTGGRPDGVMYAQQAGAVALIDVWPSDEEVLHEMTVSSIWGTPTTDSASRLVQIPVLSVRHRDGQRLRQMLENGPVKVRLEGEVFSGPERINHPVASIPGTEAGRFLLMGAHIDSWYEGVTDNGTANAVLLEVARVLATRRERLRRGVRFGWWSGHSQGRYAGSAWYADAFWEDLHRGCVGYLNIDGPGCRGASEFDCRYTMAEAQSMIERTVDDLIHKPANVRRPFKAADQSFWGLGVTSFSVYRMLPQDHPDRAIVGGCSGAWWWHSPEDLIDKVDLDLLASDTQIYAALVARVCGERVLPFEVAPIAADFVAKLSELQEASQGGLDLSRGIERARALEGKAQELDRARGRLAEGSDDPPAGTHKARLMRITRILNPVLYTEAGEFDHDPAIQLPMLPGLRRSKNLPDHAPGTNERLFMETALLRQRNRVDYALLEANEAVEEVLARL
jgi:N-acetylated-alpha-linked acidic dipeptidase